ncbi:MAG TPA: carboxypeptidase-like regulatory domain-containing protein [Ruminiclostridium sp.]
MELEDQLLEEKKPKKNIGKNRVNLEKDSIQYNAQDLDQEQKVDVNPVQLNTQNLHVFVGSNDYSGKITGTSYLEKNKEIVMNVDILLFFGHEQKLPVHKTNSDNNGNFIIEDIPPGYYTLVAELGEKLKYQSHYIKVLPCQNVHHSILLK